MLHEALIVQIEVGACRVTTQPERSHVMCQARLRCKSMAHITVYVLMLLCLMPCQRRK